MSVVALILEVFQGWERAETHAVHSPPQAAAAGLCGPGCGPGGQGGTVGAAGEQKGLVAIEIPCCICSARPPARTENGDSFTRAFFVRNFGPLLPSFLFFVWCSF